MSFNVLYSKKVNKVLIEGGVPKNVSKKMPWWRPTAPWGPLAPGPSRLEGAPSWGCPL